VTNGIVFPSLSFYEMLAFLTQRLFQTFRFSLPFPSLIEFFFFAVDGVCFFLGYVLFSFFFGFVAFDDAFLTSGSKSMTLVAMFFFSFPSIAPAPKRWHPRRFLFSLLPRYQRDFFDRNYLIHSSAPPSFLA